MSKKTAADILTEMQQSEELERRQETLELLNFVLTSFAEQNGLKYQRLTLDQCPKLE